MSNYKTDIDTVISVLSQPSVQKSLVQIKCNNVLASKCSAILSLCKEWKIIETIELVLGNILQFKHVTQVPKIKKEIINCWENIKTIKIGYLLDNES